MRQFVYVHIPRTGGTSMLRMLQSTVGDKFLHDLTFRLDRHLRHGMIVIDKSSTHHLNVPSYTKVVAGHFMYNKYDYLEWPLATMLRDPVKRVIAYYSVWRHRRKDHPYTFRDWVERYPNYMYQMTGGDLSKFRFVGITEDFGKSIRLMEAMMNFKFKTPMMVTNWFPYKKSVALRTRNWVKKVNYLDVQLYEEAKERFKNDRLTYNV